MSLILLVDDDESVRLTCSALLELDGHEVHESRTLAEARERLAGGDSYEVVLVDRGLPDGRGDGLVPEVRAALPGARTVITSGDLDGVQHVGADAYYVKGWDASELVKIIQDLLGR